MANINSPAVTALASAPVVAKNTYRGNVQAIPFRIDNGESLINNGDTITFTKALPAGCKALGVSLFSAGVASGATLTFSAGSTTISTALAIGSAINGFFHFYEAGSDSVACAGETIIGTVGGANWDDGANDLWGAIYIITEE